MAEAELPKQELLIKLLALTASDSEGEALSAMRKANSLLATAGWTWDKLIRGKIRVIADPFQNLATPPNVARTTSPPPKYDDLQAATRRPQASPRPTTPPRRSWQDVQFNPPRGAKMSKTRKGPDLSEL